MAKKGKLVVISGPSGVGKGTICKEVVKKTNTVISISVSTRLRSESETEGKDYYFVSREEFQKRIENNEFLEFAEVFGNYYGTLKDKTEKLLGEGKNVILEIDVQGGRQVKEQYPETVMVFIMPPSRDELAKRITGRARGEDAQTAKRRLDGSSREIDEAREFYDYKVMNDQLGKAVEEVINIIEGKTGEI